MSNKCLVLGGNGFIGKAIVNKLIYEGFAVTILDCQEDRSSGNNKVVSIVGDIRDEAILDSAIHGQDVIIHLISTTTPQRSMEEPFQPFNIDVIQTIKLMEKACKSGVRRVIFASSGGTVYGIPKQSPIREDQDSSPINYYGIMKLTIEKILKMYNASHSMENIILRISNPYGIGQDPRSNVGAINVFLNRVLSGEVLNIFGDGSVERDYIYIDDVADAFYRSVIYNGIEDTFNIGSGQGTSIKEIISIIESILKKPIAVEYLPKRTFDVPSNILDITKAEQHLGFFPSIQLAEGIKHCFDSLSDKVIQANKSY